MLKIKIEYFINNIGLFFSWRNLIAPDVSNSSFRLYDGENILKEWQLEKGCCGCDGTCYSILTNKRILTRHEGSLPCGGCCCRPPYIDSSIYLSDIQQILKIENRRSFWFYFLLILTGLIIIYFLCGWCCCRKYHLQLRGAFGFHHIYFSRVDLMDAQLTISSIIDKNKANNLQDVNQNNIIAQF